MDIYEVVATVIVLTTLLNYFNRRVLRLHPTIGMMLAGLIVAVGLAIAGRIEPVIIVRVRLWLTHLDFDDLVLKGLLAFLLFAGARKILVQRLIKRIWPIGLFAFGGVLLSAFIIGFVLSWISDLFGFGLNFLDCLLFGAVISPTDPIAVLSILARVGAPKNLEMDIEGESLFNDGIGVVLFLVVARVMTTPAGVGVGQVLGLFALEAVGGIALGGLMGIVASRMIRTNQDTRTQLLLTLCIVTGGYQLADFLHTSGPLAMVVAGIVVGNHEDWMKADNRVHLDSFWDLIDEVGNAVLFMLVGLELLLIGQEVLPEWKICLLAGAIAIPVVLLARYVSLLLPFFALKAKYRFVPGTLNIMTWGGLRGGLPLAMALCIPTAQAQMQTYHITHGQTLDRAMLLMMTYAAVVFSILAQGLTIQSVVAYYVRKTPKDMMD